MMWLEAIFSSLLFLSALILFFQAPILQQNQLNFYEYTYLTDTLFLAINSNFSNFCEGIKNERFCTRCSITSLDTNLFTNSSTLIPHFEDILLEKDIKEEVEQSNLDLLTLGLVDVEDKEIFSSTACEQFYRSNNIKKSITINHLFYVASGLKKISISLFYPIS